MYLISISMNGGLSLKATTEIILPNILLTCLTTDKFKTGSLSVNLLAPLKRETASLNALIPYVLNRGTATLPEMAAIAARLDNLYGARLSPIVRKKGEVQVIGFVADFADDKFIPEDSSNLEDICSLIGEMLLIPNTYGGLLRRVYVDSEKGKLLEKIGSRINDKRTYSVQRLIELMCSMEDYSVYRLGSELEAESISSRSLTHNYHDLLAAAPVTVFYCGSAEPERVKAAVKEAFAPIPRNYAEDNIGTEIRLNPLEDQPRYFEEEMGVTQGKLALGFRLGECMEDPNIAKIKVFNAIYGGAVTSKLFMNVREKLSLAYFASSSVDIHKGIMTVSSGIDFDKYDAALSEILDQLEAVKKGQISPEELSSAKRSVSGEYRTIEDNPPSLENFYLDRAIIGPQCTPLELAALAETVTIDDVVSIAKGVECDALYFLRGTKEDR